MTTINSQCPQCGRLFSTINAMLKHRSHKHGWKPPVKPAETQKAEYSRDRQRRDSDRLYAARLMGLLVAATLLLFAPAGAVHADRPASVGPSAQWQNLAEPRAADEPTPAEPGVTIEVPANARAGSRVTVRAVTKHIDPKTPLSWKLPDAAIDDEHGRYTFRQAIETADGGRTLEIVWPETGEFALAVRAAEAVPTGDTGAQGQPIYRVVIVEHEATLKLVGREPAPPGPAPEPPDNLNLPTPPAELAALAAPIGAALSGHADTARELARVWSQIALVIERGFGKTTPAVRQLHIDTAKYTTFGQLAGAVPGLGTAVDAYLEKTVGLEGAVIDAARRAQLTAAFRALASAAQAAAE